jgi:hypothetical protein
MLALLLSGLLTQAEKNEKIDQVQVIRGSSAFDLEWADAEDRMHGTVRPLDPVAGRPLDVSAMVGTFQGAEFDGPVAFTLRCEGAAETQTVRRLKGERAWGAHFIPSVDGDCSVDLGFTTTRHKLLHFKVQVQPAPLPRTPWYVLLGLFITVTLGLGIRAVFKPRNESGHDERPVGPK